MFEGTWRDLRVRAGPAIRHGLVASCAVMTTTQAHVHHLYTNGPAIDLIPLCGVTPGPDPATGDWHTGHDGDLLLEYVAAGQVCCMVCLSSMNAGPIAVSGVDPAGFDEFSDDEPSWAEDDLF